MRWSEALFLLLTLLAEAPCPAQTGQSERGVRPSPAEPTDRSTQEDEVKVAVVVGINSYPSYSDLAPLRYAEADARAVADRLTELKYRVRYLHGEEATGSPILGAIDEAGRSIGSSQGTLVFYFAGHGLSDQDRKNYLVPFGAGRERMSREALELAEVEEHLIQTPARRKVIWIDACRDVALTGRRGSGEKMAFADFHAASGVRMLLATGPGDTSREFDELKHGAFTYFLLEALQPGSGTARQDGIITFSSVASYVETNTKNWTRDHGRTQVPVERSDDAVGDFLLAGTAPATSAPASGRLARPAGGPLQVALETYQKQQYALARSAFLALAGGGDAEAQYYLGEIYHYGQGVDKDEAEAVKWYDRSAHGGFARSQKELGAHYNLGTGVTENLMEAVKWFQAAADQDLASAQHALGEMYWKGRGVEKDFGTAMSWFQRAAAQGDAFTMDHIGWMFAHGQGMAKDEAAAVTWYQRAADQGLAAAQAHLGSMYACRCSGLPRNFAEAAKWYELAAAQGDAGAQNDLGVMYEYGDGKPRDYQQAAQWYRKAAIQENPAAETNLGMLYAMGRGVPKDEKEGLKWIRKAAEKGYPGGQTELGFMHATGKGVDKDESEASTWFRLAASQGEPVGQMNLAILYAHGRGVPQDPAAALKWCKGAVDQDLADAQALLGEFYRTGIGVSPNNREAMKWYRLAADKGSATGQYFMGMTYANGAGVTRDAGEAMKWFRLAAEQGHAAFQQGLARMYKDANPPDYGEAYLWLSLAAADGRVDVKGETEAVKKHLSKQELAAIQERVKKWRPALNPDR